MRRDGLRRGIVTLCIFADKAPQSPWKVRQPDRRNTSGARLTGVGHSANLIGF